MKRYKYLFLQQFSESLRLSDLKGHAGISNFTNKWRKDRQKLKGAGNKSAKLIEMRVNKKEDYISFIFLSEPTYAFDTKTIVPPDMHLKKDNLYTEEIRLINFLSLLQTDPNFKNFESITLDDIKKAIKASDCKVRCDCPSQWYQGFDYYLTQYDAAIDECDIEPKRWDKPHNAGDSIICKHLSLITNSIEFYIPVMAGMIKKYFNK